MRAFVLFALATGSGFTASFTQPSAVEIVSKSLKTFETDWSQEPNYSYIDREVESKRQGKATEKTYEVLMIDGSPYRRLIAVDDQPLTSGEKAEEQRRMQAEIEKRQHESEHERNKRIGKYLTQRERQQQMFREMIDAFQFHLAGEQSVDGHDCWVLDANPKPGYEPTDHEGRVLTGMKGRLWIDKNSDQWVKVTAEVIRPVSFYGFLAKVDAGTRFLLEQQPVTNRLWLPSHFAVQVNASALGFLSENSTDDETFGNYRPMPQRLAALESGK